MFVTARYEVAGEGGVALVEEQDLVYREAAIGPQHPEPGDGPIPDAPWSATVTPDEVLLFRFSALTFNGHRIHYDRPYVTEVEGYPRLIVQGPMTALLLLELCKDHDSRPVSRFAFRGRSPLFCPGDVHLRGNPSADRTASLEAWSHDARLAMTAEVSFG